jgi:hypothetical protein
VKFNIINKAILIAASVAAIATVANAGVGETYPQSCRHYGSRGTKLGDHYFWRHDGNDIEEGFDASGRCAIITLSASDVRYPMTLDTAQYALKAILPPGYTWVYYGNNPQGNPCWATEIDGVQWLAMFYVAPTNSKATGPTMTTILRVSTRQQLIARGYMNPDGSEARTTPVNTPADISNI